MTSNLREVARAAIADKDHIQQMSDTVDDLLTIVKKQQNQIDELIKQNGKLTHALSANKPAAILKNCERERKDRRATHEKADTPKDDHRAIHEKGETPKDDGGCGHKNVGSWTKTNRTVQSGGRVTLNRIRRGRTQYATKNGGEIE